jgi:hypothetical protein
VPAGRHSQKKSGSESFARNNSGGIGEERGLDQFAALVILAKSRMRENNRAERN